MELKEDRCRTCGAPIIWVKSEKGKNMPLDAKPEKRVVINPAWGGEPSPMDGSFTGFVQATYVSHYSTCPQAQSWRGKKRSPAPGTQ